MTDFDPCEYHDAVLDWVLGSDYSGFTDGLHFLSEDEIRQLVEFYQTDAKDEWFNPLPYLLEYLESFED